MKSITKPIKTQVGSEIKELSFHVCYDQYSLSNITDKNTGDITSALLSFVDNTIENNFINSKISHSKISQFIIKDADLSNINKSISDFLNTNIEAVINSQPK